MDAIGAACCNVWQVSIKKLLPALAMSKRHVGPCASKNSGNKLHGTRGNDERHEPLMMPVLKDVTMYVLPSCSWCGRTTDAVVEFRANQSTDSR